MTASRRSRDIPFGPQFSPEQTPLPELLKVVVANQGDYARLVAAIRRRFFEGGKGDDYNKTKKADNTTLALRDYGVLGEDKSSLTELGRNLAAVRTKPAELYAAFGRHILLHLNGLPFVRTVMDLLAAGEEVTLEALPRALARRGLRVPATATHLSAMKGWLREAGVFRRGRQSYEVDEARLKELVGGLDAKDLDALAELNALQRAFLRSLVRFPQDKPAKSNEVAQMAEALYGVTFPWKSIRTSVLDACAEAGLITFSKTTKGRGAKPHLVQGTKKFNADVMAPLLESYQDRLGSKLGQALRVPLADVFKELEALDKNRKGRALELLALRLMFLLDLDFVDWRKRGKETAGAEVDVIVESARLIYSRWQIQCKNGRATLEDIAKEVGIAEFLNSNVLMVVTTRTFSGDARRYADAMMRKKNVQIILLQRPDLEQVRQTPARIVDILFAQARHAMDVKRLDVAEAVKRAEGSGEEAN